MSCVFCRIARGEIPSEKVLENDEAFAFLDINPLAPGHVLVVPKAHHERFSGLGVDEAARLADLVRRVAYRLETDLGAQGLTIAVNDGKAAGQEVPHVHVHVVPRSDGDGHGPIHRLFGGPKKAAPEDLAAVGKKLRG